MTKKNSKIMIVSFRRGIAPKSACMSTFKPLMEEIVFNGLMTRKTLSPDKSTPLEVYSKLPATSATFAVESPAISSLTSVTYPESTMTKSSMFHESYKYAFGPNMNPNPTILSTISMEYRIKNT